MRGIFVVFAVLAVVFSANAEERKKAAPRKTVPIAGGWLLTSEKQEKTKTEGTRTLLFTATGSPTLKRSSKAVGGSVDVTASAERIECDFVDKRLILSGSPRLKQVDPRSGVVVREITGEVGTVIRVPLRLGEPGSEIEVAGVGK